MKICPKCQKTYTDENLNFCLDDGTVLAQAGGEMPPTVLLNQTRVTEQSPQIPSQQMQQGGQWNTAQPQYSAQPKKSSKTWIWVLLILGSLVLLCGGGFVGFIVYVGSQVDTANVSSNNNSRTTPTPKGGDKTPVPSNSTTNTTSERTDVEKIDLEPWSKSFSAYGTKEFVGGELLLASKQKGFYYVLAGSEENKTEDADTSVTVRNVDNANSSLGYGLVFHSNPTPLQQGYAFLINSKTRKYKVVNHIPGDEKIVVAWTGSDAIRDGSQENTLEVRDLSDKIELYINGKMVNSIKNVYGYAGGVCGLYSGDGVKIAFKDLQIRR